MKQILKLNNWFGTLYPKNHTTVHTQHWVNINQTKPLYISLNDNVIRKQK